MDGFILKHILDVIHDLPIWMRHPDITIDVDWDVKLNVKPNKRNDHSHVCGHPFHRHCMLLFKLTKIGHS